MRVMVVCLALCALAACTAPPAQGPEAPNPEAQVSKSIPAPVPADATVRLTADDQGKVISVAVGQRVSVALVGVPTAGYLWAVTNKPAFLGEAQGTGGATTTDQQKPGFAGGNHWEVFTFTVTAPGEGALVLEQRRPWEPATEPANNSFKVKLKAN
jgi:predicted secreted protein